jgi:hypothetical protein
MKLPFTKMRCIRSDFAIDYFEDDLEKSSTVSSATSKNTYDNIKDNFRDFAAVSSSSKKKIWQRTALTRQPEG